MFTVESKTNEPRNETSSDLILSRSRGCLSRAPLCRHELQANRGHSQFPNNGFEQTSRDRSSGNVFLFLSVCPSSAFFLVPVSSDPLLSSLTALTFQILVSSSALPAELFQLEHFIRLAIASRDRGWDKNSGSGRDAAQDRAESLERTRCFLLLFLPLSLSLSPLEQKLW